MSELISIREYARRKGCSDTAVHKAIAAGKIVNGVIGEGRGKKINQTIADAEWEANSDTTNERVTRSGKALHEPNEKHKPQKPKTDKAAEAAKVQPQADTSLAAAKRAQAVYKAKILELDMKQRQGQLVDRDQVYKSLFVAGQEVRSSLQAIPDRVIDNILAARTRNEAHKLLADAIADALEQLSGLDKRDLTKR